MKHIVKYRVILDILLMGSIHVMKYTCLRGTPIAGQQQQNPQERLQVFVLLAVAIPILRVLAWKNAIGTMTRCVWGLDVQIKAHTGSHTGPIGINI